MRAVAFWSGGKDGLYALAEARRAGHEIVGLCATLNAPLDRVSMHGVPATLLRRQAGVLGLPAWMVRVPVPADAGRFVAFPPNTAYEAAAGAMLRALAAGGVEAVVFGDIHLDDLRRYKEGLLGAAGLAALFPLWGRPSRTLVAEMIDAGYHAHTVCVDAARLDASFVGRPVDGAFVASLPDGVDPCGEGGEYHTIVSDGPGFAAPLALAFAPAVREAGFWFAEVSGREAR